MDCRDDMMAGFITIFFGRIAHLHGHELGGSAVGRMQRMRMRSLRGPQTD